MRQYEQAREAWDADALEVTSDFIHAADRVAARLIWHGAGHGPEANIEMTAVWTLRRGRTVAIDLFWDHAEALETMGLSE